MKTKAGKQKWKRNMKLSPDGKKCTDPRCPHANYPHWHGIRRGPDGRAISSTRDLHGKRKLKKSVHKQKQKFKR